MNLSLVLLDRAARTPHAPALESVDGTLTFASLADLARRAAALVGREAVRGDAPVALLMDGDARFVDWFLGIALAGHPVLPLNARLTSREITQQLVDAGVARLVADPVDTRLEDIGARLPTLGILRAPDLAELPQAQGPCPGESVADDATLAVLFTSGTSGRAKGACLSWRNFAASAAAAEERLGRAVGKRWLACMPLFHVGGLSMVARSLCFGGPVRLQARFDPVAVSDALDAGDVAGISLVPTMLSRLLHHRGDRRAPESLEVLLLGGAAAAPALVARALELGYPVCTTYGLTEATSQVATSAPPAAGDAAPRPMRPLDGIEIRIVERGCDVLAGEPGEILVRGPTVMIGYLGDSSASARALRDGWLHTGDAGFLDDEGGLHVLDRRDDLVVSGGENVYPAEIEAVLLEHPSVAEAGVTGVPDADLGARVVAWVVLHATAVPDAAALSQHCAGRLASFKRPREFRFVTVLPRTAAGKLQRRRLLEDLAAD